MIGFQVLFTRFLEASGSDLETVIKKEKEVFKLPRNANQIWTDVDLAKLARLIKKYPTGKYVKNVLKTLEFICF